MYLQGMLPSKHEERVVLQVLNAAGARSRPAVTSRQSMWCEVLRLWCPSWYLDQPYVLRLVPMLVGLLRAAARDNCYKYFLSMSVPEDVYICSALWEQVPAFLGSTASILGRPACAVTSSSWV